MKDLQAKIKRIARSQLTEKVNEMFSNILRNNTGYSVMYDIRDILLEHKRQISCDNVVMPDISYFKFAPIISCIVERDFSKYILSEKRRIFSFETQTENIYGHSG